MMPHMKKKKPSKNLPPSQLKSDKLYSSTTLKTPFYSFFNKKKTSRLKYTIKARNIEIEKKNKKTCNTKIEKEEKKTYDTNIDHHPFPLGLRQPELEAHRERKSTTIKLSEPKLVLFFFFFKFGYAMLLFIECFCCIGLDLILALIHFCFELLSSPWNFHWDQISTELNVTLVGSQIILSTILEITHNNANIYLENPFSLKGKNHETNSK